MKGIMEAINFRAASLGRLRRYVVLFEAEIDLFARHTYMGRVQMDG